MKLLIVTPKRQGNQNTAARWQAMLRELGHDVSIIYQYKDEPTEVLVALNAYRSASSIKHFRDHNPGYPVIVALTGTDLYHFLAEKPGPTRRSLDLADRLIVLNKLAARSLPDAEVKKAFLILQSAQPLKSPRHPSTRHFEICVVAHLRAIKDPLRTAIAARGLPKSSRIRVAHFGGANSQEWEQAARDEMESNPRFHWYGEVTHARVREALAHCSLLVISSLEEGGANTLSEAIVARVPVIASRIDGNVGLLGEDYPGYFPSEDTSALQRLLLRAEQDPDFVDELQRRVTRLGPEFTYEHETDRLAELLRGLEEPFPLRFRQL